MDKKNLIFLFVGIVLGTLIVGGIFYLALTKTPINISQTTLPGPVTPSSNFPTTLPTETEATIKTGIIEGSLSYPSEQIPADMTVCAENTLTQEKFCTKEHIKSDKYTYGLGYKLDATPGKYFVYALTPNAQGEYRAYYSEFVTCGLKFECESHQPIEVFVELNKTTDKIDPQDWYNIPTPTPTTGL